MLLHHIPNSLNRPGSLVFFFKLSIQCIIRITFEVCIKHLSSETYWAPLTLEVCAPSNKINGKIKSHPSSVSSLHKFEKYEKIKINRTISPLQTNGYIPASHYYILDAKFHFDSTLLFTVMLFKYNNFSTLALHVFQKIKAVRLERTKVKSRAKSQ